MYEVEDELSFTLLTNNNSKYDITIFNVDDDPSVAGKEYKFTIDSSSLSLVGNHRNCKMFVDSVSSQASLFKLNETLDRFEMRANLTELLSITNNTYIQSGDLRVS